MNKSGLSALLLIVAAACQDTSRSVQPDAQPPLKTSAVRTSVDGIPSEYIVVFNDNGWSISENVGWLAHWRNKVMLNPKYQRLTETGEKLLSKLPHGEQAWELARKLKEIDARTTPSPLPPERLAGLIALIEKGTISGSIAKDVFEKMFATGRAAGDIVAAEGLTQISDESQIVGLIADVLAKNGDAVAQYRAGKTATFGFLVGQVMKAAAGKANPKRVNELLREALGA